MELMVSLHCCCLDTWDWCHFWVQLFIIKNDFMAATKPGFMASTMAASNHQAFSATALSIDSFS